MQRTVERSGVAALAHLVEEQITEEPVAPAHAVCAAAATVNSAGADSVRSL